MKFFGLKGHNMTTPPRVAFKQCRSVEAHNEAACHAQKLDSCSSRWLTWQPIEIEIFANIIHLVFKIEKVRGHLERGWSDVLHFRDKNRRHRFTCPHFHLHVIICLCLPSGSSLGDCTSGSAKEDELAVEEIDMRSPKGTGKRNILNKKLRKTRNLHLWLSNGTRAQR